MNPRTTGILFVVAAALAAFVYFYEMGGETGRREAEEADKRVFVGLEPADVTAVELTASDGVALRAEREGGSWQIVEPLLFPADDNALDAIAAALVRTLGETAIEDSQDAAVYGLDADERELRFTAGGEQHALRVGDKTPVGANSYVSVVGADRVYIVPTSSVNAYARAFDDLRDKRILDFDPGGVNRLEASWHGGRVVLSRGDEGWEIVEPIEGAADIQLVEDLLSTLSYLRADGIVDLVPTDEQTGLDRPVFAVRLTGNVPGEAGGPFEAELAVGSRADGNSLLARGAQESLYRISGDRLEDFPTDLVAYRFKQLAEFALPDAKRVEILFHTPAGESIAIEAERTGGSWASTPETFQPGKLTALTGALSNLRASDIAADSMGDEELRGLELNPANAVFRVLGASGEADGAEAGADAGAETPVASPEIAHVSLGLMRGTDGIVAQRRGDPTVYVLDYELSEHLPVSWEAFENRFRSEAAPAEAEPETSPAD